MSLLVVHWYFVLLSITMHNQHFKNTKVKSNSKKSRLITWRFVRLWPIVLRRKNMMEKYNSPGHRDKITQTVIV